MSQAEENSWKRNLYIIWFAEFLGALGMSACLPFLPLYVRELGVLDPAEAQTWAGITYSAPFLCAAFLTPFWGALGDRAGRKLMLMRAYVGVSIMTLLMGMAENVWQFFGLRLAQGAVSGFVASSIALVAVTTPAINSGYALGFLQTALSSGNIIGPLIGGVCADFFGMRPAFFLVSGLCVLSAVVIGFMAHERPADAALGAVQAARKPRRVSDNVRVLIKNAEMRFILLIMLLSMLGLSATQPVLAFFVEATGAPHRFVGTITGALVGMVGILGIIFAPYWGRRSDTQPWQRIIRNSAPILAGTFILQALVTNYLYLFPLRFVMAIFTASILPSLFGGLSRLTSQESRGGMMAFGSSATMLGQLISPALAGLIAAQFGLPWAFILSSAFFAAVFFLVRAKFKNASATAVD